MHSPLSDAASPSPARHVGGPFSFLASPDKQPPSLLSREMDELCLVEMKMKKEMRLQLKLKTRHTARTSSHSARKMASSFPCYSGRRRT